MAARVKPMKLDPLQGAPMPNVPADDEAASKGGPQGVEMRTLGGRKPTLGSLKAAAYMPGLLVSRHLMEEMNGESGSSRDLLTPSGGGGSGEGKLGLGESIDDLARKVTFAEPKPFDPAEAVAAQAPGKGASGGVNKHKLRQVAMRNKQLLRTIGQTAVTASRLTQEQKVRDKIFGVAVRLAAQRSGFEPIDVLTVAFVRLCAASLCRA